MTHVVVPQELESRRRLGSAWGDWLDRLPHRTADLLGEWELRPDGEAMHGHASLVVPVLTGDDEPAVLKVAFDGDDESEHEALALQRWGGAGAVRLLRPDPHRRALLLERLHTSDLSDVWDMEACEVVAGLYGKLHVPAPPQLRTVTSYVQRWLDDLAALGHDVPMPRRYIEQALSLGRDLVSDPASSGVMVHGDLHHANVLAADRAPWLVIDPKPMSGDPHYEPAPMLWNRWDDLDPASGGQGIREGVRRRFHALVDAADLQEERARDWVIVRMVLNASWSIVAAHRTGTGLDNLDQQWITRCLAVTKAVQD